jgi:hypothetical protein
VYKRQEFAPGPITLILKKKEFLSDIITGGQNTVGIRSPNHELAQDILEKAGAIVAPSANPFGKTSPSCAAHVSYHFPELPVVNGDHCSIGIESTIIDCSNDIPRILRHGEIHQQNIEQVLKNLGISLLIKNNTDNNDNIDNKTINTPRFSGEMKAHYAPMIPLLLIDNKSNNNDNVKKQSIDNIEKIKSFAQKKHKKELSLCLFYNDEQQLKQIAVYQKILAQENIKLHIQYQQLIEKEDYAHSLYDMFYSYLTPEVKKSQVIDLLMIGDIHQLEYEKNHGKYQAVIERLNKAAYGSWLSD